MQALRWWWGLGTRLYATVANPSTSAYGLSYPDVPREALERWGFVGWREAIPGANCPPWRAVRRDTTPINLPGCVCRTTGRLPAPTAHVRPATCVCVLRCAVARRVRRIRTERPVGRRRAVLGPPREL